MIPSFYVAQGSFARPTEAGVYTVTGLSFQPKCYLLYGNLQSTTGDGADSRFILGAAADDDTSFTAISVLYTDPTIFTYSGGSLSSYIGGSVYECYYNGGGYIIQEASGVTAGMTADGFSIDFVVVDANSPTINWVALGGDAITSVSCGEKLVHTKTGTFECSLGFGPDIVLMSIIGPATGGTTQELSFGHSFSVSEANGGTAAGQAYSAAADDTNTPTNTHKGIRQSACLLQLNPNTAAINRIGAYAGPTGSGFNINQTTAVNTQTYVRYLGIKGLSGFTGLTNARTTTGTTSITTMPFQPKVLFVNNPMRAAGPGVTAGMGHGQGVGTSDANQFVMGQGSLDNQNPTPVNRETLNTTNILETFAPTSTGITLNARAELDSLDSAGFTINFTTVDATTRAYQYLGLNAKPIYPAVLFGTNTGEYRVVTKSWNLDDWDVNPDGWSVISGNWNVASGRDSLSGGFYGSCFSGGKGCNFSIEFEWDGTWEDLGVPSGATVEFIAGGWTDGVNTGIDALGYGSEPNITFVVKDEFDVTLANIADIYPTGTWKSYGQGYAEGSYASLESPSNTTIKLNLSGGGYLPNGTLGGAGVNIDNIGIAIKYRL